MHDHRPAPHVLLFYWCIWLVDVTALKVGRRLNRGWAHGDKPQLGVGASCPAPAELDSLAGRTSVPTA